MREQPEITCPTPSQYDKQAKVCKFPETQQTEQIVVYFGELEDMIDLFVFDSNNQTAEIIEDWEIVSLSNQEMELRINLRQVEIANEQFKL